jgi:hypothetical protein
MIRISNEDRYRFRRQWAVLRENDGFDSNWKRFRFSSGDTLYAHPDLPTRIHESEGSVRVELGILLDGPIEHEIPNDCVAGESLEQFDRWVSGVAGTYVVLRYTEDSLSIYTDPGAMMGVYYHEGRASSSPSLLPGIERDERIDSMYRLDPQNDWFTGSICPFKGVKFLLANHCLTLASGVIRRFWPITISAGADPLESISKCGNLLRSTVEQVSSHGTLLLSLTGGKDSRVNLAAAKNILGGIQCFTIRAPGVSKCDVSIPNSLASRFSDISHRFADVPESEPWLTEYYDEISGHMSVGARRGILGECLEISKFGTIHLSGSLGGVSKAHFWHSKHPQDVMIKSILSKFSNPAPCIIDGITEWLKTVPSGMAPSAIYNLFYLEQRGGRWAGVGENASALFYQPISGFNSRQYFEALCSVPEEMQFEGRLNVEMIRNLWPELLQVPFCPANHKRRV